MFPVTCRGYFCSVGTFSFFLISLPLSLSPFPWTNKPKRQKRFRCTFFPSKYTIIPLKKVLDTFEKKSGRGESNTNQEDCSVVDLVISRAVLNSDRARSKVQWSPFLTLKIPESISENMESSSVHILGYFSGSRPRQMQAK